ncbi:MAG: hypothetical protein JOZ86_16270 [Candidatus Eremiobacteraeota bacterium]|nr:hypothetical protein [Candidatus Eremiobacteraeota bacterium]
MTTVQPDAGAADQSGAPQDQTGGRRELIFGLVAPLGVDKDVVVKVLRQALSAAGYQLRTIKISTLIREYARDIDAIKNAEPLHRKRLLMNVGDKLRRDWDAFNSRTERRGDFGAILAISAIQQLRQRINKARGVQPEEEQPLETIPISSAAYLVDSLKHPDELEYLRRVYGPAFVSIGVYTPPEIRRRDLGLDALDDDDRKLVEALMKRDEVDTKLGQRVGEAFYGTDFIVDSTEDPDEIRDELVRLVHLLFGDVFQTPRLAEYGMFLARAAQARSGSMARQIGAAILRDDGSVVACGTNEAAKAVTGGQYWPDDDAEFHGRDMVYTPKEGAPVRDTSDAFREEMISTVVEALAKAGVLAGDYSDMTPEKRLKELYTTDGAPLRNTRIKDNIDYIRAVHAEAAAIIDAGRHGVATKGTRMFTSTFPCHECARHIVAAGIRQVVYLEPYPKSATKDLYRDSVALDPTSDDPHRVVFRTFVGVAPPRYLEFFLLGQRLRKQGDGTKIPIDIATRAPSLPYYTPSIASVAQAERVPMRLFKEFTSYITENIGGLDEQSP